MSMCASASDSGAGPRTTLPWKLYCDPWHGHLNLFSFCASASTRSAQLPADYSCRYHHTLRDQREVSEACRKRRMRADMLRTVSQGTTQPRCVQTAFRPNFSISPWSLTIRYVASACTQATLFRLQCCTTSKLTESIVVDSSGGRGRAADLQALREAVVAWLVGRQPLGRLDVVAKRVLRHNAAAGGARAAQPRPVSAQDTLGVALPGRGAKGGGAYRRRWIRRAGSSTSSARKNRRTVRAGQCPGGRGRRRAAGSSQSASERPARSPDQCLAGQWGSHRRPGQRRRQRPSRPCAAAAAPAIAATVASSRPRCRWTPRMAACWSSASCWLLLDLNAGAQTRWPQNPR